LVIADHLTRQGISVLRFDDHGVGQSEGDHAMATSADFATDVLAAVSYLKKSPHVDPENIGLIGHSEGGLIAPMVAAQDPDIAFIALLAGPGVPGDEIIFLQQKLIGEAEGTDKKELKENNKFLRKAFKQMRKSDNFEQIKERLATKIKKGLIKQGVDAKEVEQISNQTLASITNPRFKFFIDYDPVFSLQKVHCPVLALNGGKDLQVDANQNLPVIKKALAGAGNQDVTIKILPGLNHLFQSSDSGKPSEYGKLEETFSPVALEEISMWIRVKTK
jgi:alpha-beta hydrolase superfamily lysophospholipase